RFGSVRFGSVRFGSVRFGSVFNTSLLIPSVLLFATACGSSGTESFGVTNAELATACEKGVALKDHYHFEHIGVSVTRTVCLPEGDGVPDVVTTDDATGKLVDFAVLGVADRESFHGWHASMHPDLRQMLAAKTGEAQDVYVWFHVDGSDAPNKEWLVAEGAANADAVASRELRTRAAAQSLASKLSTAGNFDITGNLTPPVEYGIPVIRVRAALADLETVGTWPEVWRIDRVPTEHKLQDETYYFTTMEFVIDYYLGHDGTGVTVATYEGNRPDSWANLPGAPSGSCGGVPGGSRKCHCAAGPTHEHSRGMMGIVRRSAGTLGMANNATTIMANPGGGCVTHGTDEYASALNWATSNGATVISHSACTGVEASPNAHDIFFDFKASVYPYPLVAAAAGNSSVETVCNKLRNGLSVGGSLESPGSPDRSQATADENKSYLNGSSGANGYEVPHLTAISEGVNTAGYMEAYPTAYNWGGTSVAAPQVAGIAASLQEANPALKAWPEAMVPGLMASANEDTDNTVLSLHDGIDDRDGAGLINATEAFFVLQASAKMNGGNSAVPDGHDYGTLLASTTPVYTYYSEQYNARVAAGYELRVAAFMQTRPTCSSSQNSNSCSANPYPSFLLLVYDGGTYVKGSSNANNNYQYVAFVNGSGVQKDYTIKVMMLDWAGLSGTTFGIAWSS
ncbi:MAG: S8/S53 family peptidase, partial [Myxococcales bacterium]|nr:S8/S53 family peptidase [Myxococcales bacterium]